MDQFLVEVEEVKKELKNVRKSYIEKSEKALNKAAASIFKANPYLDGFSWRQGTDGFCDGDPCYFYVLNDVENILLQLNESIGEEISDGVLEDVEIHNLYHEENHRTETYTASRYNYNVPHSSPNYGKRIEYQTTRQIHDDVPNEGAEELVKVYEHVSSLLSAIGDKALEELFGDCVKVTAKRDGTFDIEESWFE